MFKIVFSDLEGTFLNSKQRISETAKRKIKS